jgi:flagellar hook-associated protein 3 FlgL
MRITNNMLSNTTLRNLNTNMERLDRLQNELTSGQRISTPSDDPIGTASALEFRTTIAQIDQYIRNADEATSWLDATDSALGSMSSLLQRAQELAVEGASDTYSNADKQAMAAEVQNLLDQSVAVGNSTYGGRYLFGGYRVNTQPFAAVGNPPTAVNYNGDTGQIIRQIDEQSTVTVNITGSTAFNSVFTALIGLRDDLNNGNSVAVSNRLTDLKSALESVVSTRAEVGARANRLSTQKDNLESLKVNLSGLLSKAEDVDMTEAITEFATQQTVYQVALAAGAKAIQPSLIDYLR